MRYVRPRRSALRRSWRSPAKVRSGGLTPGDTEQPLKQWRLWRDWHFLRKYADLPQLLCPRTDFIPYSLDERVGQVGFDVDHSANVDGAQHAESVDLLEIIGRREVAERQVDRAAEVRGLQGLSRCACFFDKRREACLRVLAEQVSVKLVAADFVHRPTGQYVRHPGVVVSQIVYDFAERRRVRRRTSVEVGRNRHQPLVVADLGDNPVQGVVSKHEYFGFVH